MRYFTTTLVVALCYLSPWAPMVAHADNIAERTLVGYSVPLSVRPGDTVEFKVSSFAGDYEADLVEVINGDALSRYREMFEVRPVKAKFAGGYDGAEQPLNLGSYVHVDDAGALDGLSDFTVAAWVFPTFDPTEYEPPDLENPDPFYPPTLSIAPLIVEDSQTVVSRFDAATGAGWALRIDSQFRLEFVAGDGSGKVRIIRMSQTLRDWDWAYVAASYDAGSGAVTLHLREKPYSPGDQFTARNLQSTGTIGALTQAGPLRIAAVRDGAGAAEAALEKPGNVYNGRIQDVRIASRTLSADEVDALSAETVPVSLSATIVADWDFARDIDSTNIRDASGSGLDGVAVNLPERAVRGRRWNGQTINWTDAPDLYDAINFHADDLYDAEWSTDFRYTLPADLDSGIYAARLTQGDFVEYIPFFVAAPKGKPTAKLAVWLSDYNYLAYANITLPSTVPQNYPGQNLNESDAEFMKANLTYGTAGVYNTHVDGTYFIYGTRLRPDIHMKPGAFLYNFPADTHIVSFLDHEGIDFDIITDEQVDAEGLALLQQYPVIISSTHHEYVTQAQFDAVGTYTAEGGRFVYIGGNGWFWSVAGHPTLPGVMESRNFIEIAERYLTNGERGGLMVETGRQSGPIFGNEMGGMIFNGSSAYGKLEDADDPRAAWIFAGTTEGKVFGDYGIDRVHGGAAGFEVDRYKAGNGVPRHALHLATSEPLRPTIEDVIVTNLPLTIKYHPDTGDPWTQADLVFFETANSGAMFSTGSITWISSTMENDFDNDIARITGNVIRRFLDPAPFPPIPEASVDDVDREPGNPEYDIPINTTEK